MIDQLIAWIGGAVLAIGAIWKLVEKYSPKIRKASKVTAETLELVNTLLDAVEDRKITKEEVELVMQKINDLQEVLK